MFSEVLVRGALKRLRNLVIFDQLLGSCQLILDGSQRVWVLLRIIKSGHLLRKNWKCHVGLEVVSQSLVDAVLEISVLEKVDVPAL